jgi:PAS domain S-box-containing protein
VSSAASQRDVHPDALYANGEEAGGINFRDLLEAAPDAIVIVDSSGDIQLVNLQTERLFGYERSELIGQAVELLVPKRFRDRHPGHRSGYFETPVVRAMGAELDIYGLRKDGTEFPVEISLSPLETEIGVLTSAAIRDVTERKRVEEQQRRAHALLEAAPDAIVICDSSGAIQLVNAQTERLFGYPRSKLIGHPVELLVPELLVPERFRDRQPGNFTSPPEEKMGTQLDLYGLRSDGGEFPVEISLSPLETEDGVLVSAAIHDVTERKRAQMEELERANKELERANKELESFSSSVSHDLRAPLRTVDGFTRILVDEYAANLPPEASRYIGLVRSGTEQMGRLVDGLLSFSRLGRQKLRTRPVSTHQLVQEALDTLEQDQEGRLIEFVVGELPACEADPTLLKQVFANLLSNAVKFTAGRSPAVVEIGSELRDGERTWYVRDNGAGFDMKYADKLFGVFQRLHRSEDYEGTGIGLATAERIVSRHGGRIWGESEPEKGATFYFTLAKDRDG